MAGSAQARIAQMRWVWQLGTGFPIANTLSVAPKRTSDPAGLHLGWARLRWEWWRDRVPLNICYHYQQMNDRQDLLDAIYSQQ